MSVELSPANQLGFPRPLTQLVKRSLYIHNPHSQPVAFKVKTTAPKQYCVRPNSGRVESGESVEVQVLLQALNVEPPPHAKCRDKFLVQSAFITPDQEMRTLAEMWTHVEQTDKSAIHEQKVKCAYLAPEDGAAANGIPEEGEETMDQSRMEESAIFDAAPSSPTHNNASSGALGGPIAALGNLTNGSSPATSGERSAPSVPQTAISPSLPKLESGAATTNNNNNNSTTTSREIPSLTAEDIQKTSAASPTNVALEQSLAATSSDSEKLRIALKEIDKLRSELDEARGPQATGLRKRGGAGSSAGGSAEVAIEKAKEAVGNVASGNQGVPLEVVVGLVVGVFVMTYMFF